MQADLSEEAALGDLEGSAGQRWHLGSVIQAACGHGVRRGPGLQHPLGEETHHSQIWHWQGIEGMSHRDQMSGLRAW